MENILNLFARQSHTFVHFMRIAIFIVLVWIGGLKAFPYEADGIVPFVINSPLMSFFYHNTHQKALNAEGKPVAAYTLHKNPEGKTVQENINWHRANGTYAFSYGLGAVFCGIGFLVVSGIWFPKAGFWGGILTTGMSAVTLSFLLTTPEVYVPDMGGDFPTPHNGFPYLSAAGRLVVKDVIMMAGGFIISSECASRILKKRTGSIYRS